MVKIIGEVDLLNETDTLKEIATRHPFGEYAQTIKSVELFHTKNVTSIDVDETNKVLLYLTGEEKLSNRYRYILLHEFGHVYDRFDPAFAYTLDMRLSLNMDRDKLYFVTDLWNAYIDGRLDNLNLLEFEQPPEEVISIRHKKSIIINSNYGNIEELACSNCRMDMNLEDLRKLFWRVWRSPAGTLTYSSFFECYEKKWI